MCRNYTWIFIDPQFFFSAAAGCMVVFTSWIACLHYDIMNIPYTNVSMLCNLRVRCGKKNKQKKGTASKNVKKHEWK